MWAFCYGHDAVAQEAFKTVAKPLIEKAIKEAQPDVALTQMKLLDELEKRIPVINKGNSNGNGSYDSDKLVALRRELVKLNKEVMGVKPCQATIEGRRKKILDSIEETSHKVVQLIDGVGAV
jgi:hypothetical protein